MSALCHYAQILDAVCTSRNSRTPKKLALEMLKGEAEWRGRIATLEPRFR